MLSENRSIGDRFRVFKSIDRVRYVAFRCILPKADQRPVFILGDVVIKIDECRNLFRSGVLWIYNQTAPQIVLSKSEKIETGDNTQIVPSTFKGLEQVGIGIFVGIHNSSVAENNLHGFSAFMFIISRIE